MELRVNGTPKWATTTAYAGAERVVVTPPTGAAPTITTTDIRGRTVRFVEKGTAPGSSTGDNDVAIDYTYDVSNQLTRLVGSAARSGDTLLRC